MEEPTHTPGLQASRNAVRVRERLRALQTPLRYLKGIGPKRAEQLEAFGLRTVEDLLYHLPFRYDDRRQIKRIQDAVAGEIASFVGELACLAKKYNPRRRSQILSAQLFQEGAALELFWYRAPAYLAGSLANGQTLLVHGRVEQSGAGRRRIVHPDFDVLPAGEATRLEKILPVYVRPGGVPLSLLRKWIGQALIEYGGFIPDYLPAEITRRHNLLGLTNALKKLHQPDTETDASTLNDLSSAAQRSLVFEELFYLQLGLALRKQDRNRVAATPFTGAQNDLTIKMRSLLPFLLTAAQERVIREIHDDMNSSRAMQRFVQGDVGSGKTIIAWFASLRVMEHGRQAVWMAPTELLAEQHMRNVAKHGDALGLRAILLTGSLSAKERTSALQEISGGRVDLIIGTHALIQEGVTIPRLGLAVIDEQHRFGVMQRLSLHRLQRNENGPMGRHPHILLMSATPIPRSLAMVLYGDMDISFLDEMPPGRKPVKTKVFGENERKTVYETVIRELKQGHQAFIIYPLVEASAQLQEVRDATQMAEKMRRGVFKNFGVGLVHGKMSAEERDAIMRRFRDARLGVLVATTVVEVGIDIPNATVMVVEHADRFGLSQLHQLRGRVGRGSTGGYCLLINRSPRNPLAAERLHVMEKECDGFKIAEADLAMRGPGEFLGTRQSGMEDFRLANLVRDSKILMDARGEAQSWLQKDPDLSTSDSAMLKEILWHRWGQRLQLGAVG